MHECYASAAAACTFSRATRSFGGGHRRVSVLLQCYHPVSMTGLPPDDSLAVDHSCAGTSVAQAANPIRTPPATASTEARAMDGQVGDVNHMLAATNPLHGAAQHHSNPLVGLPARAKQVPLLSQSQCAHESHVCTRAASCCACTCTEPLPTWQQPTDCKKLDVVRVALAVRKAHSLWLSQRITECKRARVARPCSLQF